jgi:Mn2+/Fe2+ NRAMP family transporter
VSSPESPKGKSRKGSPADRGKLVRFPRRAPPPPPQTHPDLWSTLRRLGPGVVTGAADLDPSAVVTATVAGAAFKLSLVWVVLLCVPFLLTIFSVASRVGTETRQGLLDLVRDHYGRGWAAAGAALTIVTNLVVIIADLMAVSDGFSIVLRQPRMYFVAGVAFSVWYILIFHDYKKITRALVLVSLPLYLYIAAALIAMPPAWQLIGQILTPRVRPSLGYVEAIVALLGSFLTPYILLWQVSSRTDPEHEPHAGDAHAATLVSMLLAFSVIVASASVLHLPHPADMTTREAAEALRPAVGSVGAIMFAIGIIGSGLVALPVLVSSMCYDVAQAVGWKYGLSENPWEAKGFYALISGSMFVAGAGAFLKINPVRALYWSMILAGMCLIPTLIFLIMVGNDRRIMRTVNSRWENFWIGAAAGGLIAAGATYLIWSIAAS